MSIGKWGRSGTGNGNFGYLGGGSPSTSTVDRIDYNNDTATASPRGPLSSARNGLGSAGNSDFGYFAGGKRPSPTTSYSTVDRVDYSNDTATAVAKGPLRAVRYQGLAGTGNANFGYFGGGDQGSGGTTEVERIDYSNDTATALARGPLSAGRSYISATGNADFGYFGGGQPSRSIVDRIDYSNDTGTASPKGPLSTGRSALVATGNQSFGYFAGGGSYNASTIVDRVDYSSDTATASVRGPLSAAQRYSGGNSSRENAIPAIGTVNYAAGTLGTHNKGYFFGGWSDRSEIYRLDYSNDDFTTLSTTLLQPGYGGAGLSSKIHAYHVSGTSPAPWIIYSKN